VSQGVGFCLSFLVKAVELRLDFWSNPEGFAILKREFYFLLFLARAFPLEWQISAHFLRSKKGCLFRFGEKEHNFFIVL